MEQTNGYLKVTTFWKIVGTIITLCSVIVGGIWFIIWWINNKVEINDDNLVEQGKSIERIDTNIEWIVKEMEGWKKANTQLNLLEYLKSESLTIRE